MSRVLAGLTLALALQTPATAKTPTPFPSPTSGTVVVYRNATLIDGTGTPARHAMAVVVDGQRIRSVLRDKDMPAALLDGATVIDLKGQYLLPGLIDTHVHLATPPDRKQAEAILRRDLYGGITAVRDMADDLRAIGELTRASLAGEIAAPDIHYAALMAGPSFFEDKRTWDVSRGVTPGQVPWMQAITDATDLTLAVAMARGTGASAIKIYANLPATLVAKITAEAHRQQFLVWAHASVFPASPREVIDAGVDAVSHVCYLAYQVSDAIPVSYQQRVPVAFERLAHGDNAVMAGLFRDMVDRGTLLDATGRVYSEDDKRAAANPGGKPQLCTAELAARLTRQAFRAGVQISTGTDGSAPWDDARPELYGELDFLVNMAKIPAAQVIRSATLVGAQASGQAQDTGSIAPGKLANLIVLAKDPLKDIANVRSIVMTVKRGRIFRRSDYQPVTRDEIGDED